MSDSEALRDIWLERIQRIQSLIEEDDLEQAADCLSDVAELPADPETRVLAGKAYGLLNPAAGLEILEQILQELPENESALTAKADIEEKLESASQ
ncbi:MAG: hypothetical protein AAF357_13385, partial [Verrucomicrobiota bacterium]